MRLASKQTFMVEGEGVCLRTQGELCVGWRLLFQTPLDTLKMRVIQTNGKR